MSQHFVLKKIFTHVITRFLFVYRIDTKNGNVYLIESPDREITPTLTVMVRVEVTGRKGKSSYLVHPIAHDIGNLNTFSH